MSTKKYEYFYPENKELGDKIPGMVNFITNVMLKKKYSYGYVWSVFVGVRNNIEIVSAMKKAAELANADNY